MHTTADLHAWEDAYDYDSAAVEAQQTDLVAHTFTDLRELEKALATNTVDFCDGKNIRIDGGRFYVCDALILAAFAKPEQRDVILADCKAEIVRTFVASGFAETL